MITSDYKPALKQEIEILPAEHNGRDMILIRDTEGLSNKTLIMPAETIVLLQFFNGSNTIRDIQSKLLKISGELINEAEIIDFVRQIDEANLLENEKTQEMRRKIYEEFRKSSVREAIHKGLSYPENILELTSFMSRFLKKEETNLPLKTYVGLIAPHIDLIRGGRVYAAGYKELLKSNPADVIIAFGTSHKGGNSPLILTKKAYETPYGNIDVDMDVYNRFSEILWYEADEEEYYHKNEHSLEFQALWLKYIWREKTPKWLPILTGAFERFATDIPPSKIETVEKMFQDIESLIKEISKNKRIMVVVGADFSHVGPRFGDDIEITPDVKSEIEKKDKEKINHILNLDPDGFYLSVISEKNETKICGLSAIYAALRVIRAINPDVKPHLLDYAIASDPFGGLVSFASIIF